MSYLIQLRGRIKATETTKKTTNAMRLIAMSTHMHLRQTKASLVLYERTLKSTLEEIAGKIDQSNEPVHSHEKTLFILIGSQKGLCGTFNANLALYFQRFSQQLKGNDLVIVGKQIKDRLLFQGVIPTASYDQFSLSVTPHLVNEIANYVLSPLYDAIIVISTKPKTFFLQTHEATVFKKGNFMITAITYPHENNSITEQTYTETFNFLGHAYLKAQIEEILINSLLAEASSRFLSMDAATRNADDIINHMKLDYNKLRQASITRELTDLAGIYLQKS
jgi:F-type H+-transporting ATPase subunit gamma